MAPFAKKASSISPELNPACHRLQHTHRSDAAGGSGRPNLAGATIIIRDNIPYGV
jgi:hypothetical protein